MDPDPKGKARGRGQLSIIMPAMILKLPISSK